MCTLDGITTNERTIRRPSGADRDPSGNLPPRPGTFPDFEAPVARTDAPRFLASGERGDPARAEAT